MAEKLDGVMLVVFTYLDQRLTADTSFAVEDILAAPSPSPSPATPSVSAAAAATSPAAVFGLSEGVEGVEENRPLSCGAVDVAKRRRGTSAGGQGKEPVARLLQASDVDDLARLNRLLSPQACSHMISTFSKARFIEWTDSTMSLPRRPRVHT